MIMNTNNRGARKRNDSGFTPDKLKRNVACVLGKKGVHWTIIDNGKFFVRQ